MSYLNWDRSRAHRLRKQKLLRRKKAAAVLADRAAQAAPSPKKAAKPASKRAL